MENLVQSTETLVLLYLSLDTSILNIGCNCSIIGSFSDPVLSIRVKYIQATAWYKLQSKQLLNDCVEFQHRKDESI